MKKILVSAFKSDELRYQLEEVIAVDDKIAVDEISDKTILEEAHFVLGKFTGQSGGFEQEDDYNGENGAEQRTWARKNVRVLKALIKKYDPRFINKPEYVK